MADDSPRLIAGSWRRVECRSDDRVPIKGWRAQLRIQCRAETRVVELDHMCGRWRSGRFQLPLADRCTLHVVLTKRTVEETLARREIVLC